MSNCVIRRLKESINDENLYAIDDFVINVSSATTVNTSIQASWHNTQPEIELKTTGDVYFTNSSYTENNGTEKVITDNIGNINNIYISGKNGKVILRKKYQLTNLTIGAGNVYVYMDQLIGTTKLLSFSSTYNYTYGSISSLKENIDINAIYASYLINGYIKCNYGDLANFSNLTQISVYNSKDILKDFYCNLSELPGRLTNLNLYRSPNISGDLSSIVAINNNTFDSISINGPNVTGNISVFAGKKIKNIQLQGTNVTGDVSSLNNNTGLVEISCKACTKLSPTDISKLPCILFSNNPISSGNEYVCAEEDMPEFEWPTTTSRPSNMNILALERVKLGSDIDNMLINQANLSLSSTQNQLQSGDYRKKINAMGTRTSASDSAVSTLKSKGVTVVINAVTL